MLPDIIDKPVGIYLLGNTFGNGRIFAHTLLLVVIVGLIGVYLYQSQGKAWLVTLSFGSLFHLFEDQMWLTPRTFFWPAYGWAFEKTDTSSWLQNIFYAVRTNPAVYVPELIGGHHNDEFCSQGGSF